VPSDTPRDDQVRYLMKRFKIPYAEADTLLESMEADDAE
jgi:hypothetical protein